MSKEILQRVYKNVDNLLTSLRDEGTGTLYQLGELYDTEGQMAKNILVDNGLISFQMGYVTTDSAIDINENGLSVLDAGGIEMFLSKKKNTSQEKENLELQKLRSENEVLVNELIEFPKIKTQRNWLFIIAAIELLAILIGLILQWKGKS